MAPRSWTDIETIRDLTLRTVLQRARDIKMGKLIFVISEKRTPQEFLLAGYRIINFTPRNASEYFARFGQDGCTKVIFDKFNIDNENKRAELFCTVHYASLAARGAKIISN